MNHRSSPTRTLLAPLSLALLVPASAFAQDAVTRPGASAPTAPPSVRMLWGDFDADGYRDALATSPEGGLALLHGTREGGWEDGTSHAGLAGISGVRTVEAHDYDADGLEDLLVGRADGSLTLWKNFGGTFADVTAEVGLPARGKARWLDADGDGALELYVEDEHGANLYGADASGALVPLAPAKVDAFQRRVQQAADVAASTQGGQQRPTPLASGSSPASLFASSGVPTTLGPAGGPLQAAVTAALACVLSIEDANGGGCLQASATPTLGMLYPLSSDLFVEAGTGDVGLGTTSPDRAFHLVRDSFWPMRIEGNTNPGIQIDNTAATSSWAIFHDATDSLTFRDSFDGITRMVIRGTDGRVGIGTQSPGATLDVAGSLQAFSGSFFGDVGATGTVSGAALAVTGSADVDADLNVDGAVRTVGFTRQGNETGTTQAPTVGFTYEGMIARRVVSTQTTAGDVVARARFLRLERDGTNGGVTLAWDAANLPDQVAYGTAVTNGGAVVPIVVNLGAAATAGSQPLGAPADWVRLDVAFGNTFNTRELTNVTLLRSAGDSWWVGDLRSTWNQ